MPRTLPVLVAVAAAALALGTFSPILRADEGAFARGVDAARAGDYDQAVEQFRAAQAAGLDTPALHFNLGVALYQLGRLEQAAQALRIAASTTQMAGPAAYNLGRIASTRGDDALAQEWYRRAADRAQTDAVRRRALARLTESKSEPAPALSGSLTLGLGHDSNIGLEPADTRYSRQSDWFLLTDLVAHYPLSAQWRLSAGAYHEAYADQDDFDFGAFHGAISWWPRDSATAWARHRITLRHTRFGGESLENAVSLESQFGSDIGPGHLILSLGLEGLRGSSGYDYLDGHRGSFETAWYQSALGGRWSVGHRLVTVDRADWREGDLSYSYSYRRDDLFAGYWRDLTGALRGGVELGTRRYRYDDPDAAPEYQGRRREYVRYVAAEAQWNIREGAYWALRVEQERRDSTIDLYEYGRDLATVEVTWDY